MKRRFDDGKHFCVRVVEHFHPGFNIHFPAAAPHRYIWRARPLNSDSGSPDLRKLSSFVHIAESGSLTRSPIALNIEYSGLSRQIQSFELKFGGRLFYRTEEVCC